MPARHPSVALRTSQQPVVEVRQRGVGQLGAGESLLGDLVRETGLLPKMTEELIEFGVDALRIPHSMTATSVGNGSLRRRQNAVTWSL